MAREDTRPCGTEPSSQESHSISALSRACRLSRATLRYYEKIGILQKESRLQDGKQYGDDGTLRLGMTITLRNIGLTPEEIVPLLDDDPLCPRHIAEYQAALARRISYLQAQSECLGLQARLVERKDEVWVENVDAYRFKANTPFDLAVQEAIDKEAPICTPISNGVGVFEGCDPLSPTGLRWGRGVAERYADIIPGFNADLPRVGGCLCVRAVACVNRPTGLEASSDEIESCFSRLRAYVSRNGLVATQAAFVPYFSIADGGRYLAVCLPVKRERRSVFGFLRSRRGR